MKKEEISCTGENIIFGKWEEGQKLRFLSKYFTPVLMFSMLFELDYDHAMAIPVFE